MIYEVKCPVDLCVKSIEPDGMSFRSNGELLYHTVKINFENVFPFTSNGKTFICNNITFSIHDYLNLFRNELNPSEYSEERIKEIDSLIYKKWGVTYNKDNQYMSEWRTAVDKTDVFIRDFIEGVLSKEEYGFFVMHIFGNDSKRDIRLIDIDDKNLANVISDEMQKFVINNLL